MKNLINKLNVQVANLGVLYTKLHSHHWLVEGQGFFQLHEKFEEYYDEVTEHFDEVAERILMIGGKPVGSLKEFLALTTLKEATGNETRAQMVEATIKDFEILNKEFGEVIVLAQEVGDEVTVDLAIGIIGSLQKHLWMLKAVLKK